MNFEFRFKDIENSIKSLECKLDALQTTYESAKEFTSIFLKCCEKHGIKTVSVNTYTKLLKACEGWGKVFQESVFADDREGSWPAIWAVVEEMKIGRGCGNGGQHQAHCSKLIDGVYRLKNGNWERLENGGNE